MPSAWTLTTIGILSVAGAALGIHLGKLSVSEINPIYFQVSPTRFHSDLSPYRSQAAGSSMSWADSATPMELGTGCIGCRTYPEEYFPQRDAIVDDVVEDAPEEQAPVQLAAAETAPDTSMVERQADLDRLQRYARFSISAEETVAERGQTASEPIQDEASAIQGDEVAAAE